VQTRELELPSSNRGAPIAFINRKEHEAMAVNRGRGGFGGISTGGIVVIVGIVIALFWSVWLGLIIALIGLIAFGGFVRGRWY
jgi:hypothetical protein